MLEADNSYGKHKKVNQGKRIMRPGQEGFAVLGRTVRRELNGQRLETGEEFIMQISVTQTKGTPCKAFLRWELVWKV